MVAAGFSNTRMPLGIKDSTFVSSRCLAQVLRAHRAYAVNYVDDVCITGVPPMCGHSQSYTSAIAFVNDDDEHYVDADLERQKDSVHHGDHQPDVVSSCSPSNRHTNLDMTMQPQQQQPGQPQQYGLLQAPAPPGVGNAALAADDIIAAGEQNIAPTIASAAVAFAVTAAFARLLGTVANV